LTGINVPEACPGETSGMSGSQKQFDGTVLALLGVVVFVIAVVFLVAGLMASPSAANDTPVWELSLRQQLASERGCLGPKVTSLRQFKLAGTEALEGRVRCADGREFDFTRPQPQSKFKILLCLPAVC